MARRFATQTSPSRPEPEEGGLIVAAIEESAKGFPASDAGVAPPSTGAEVCQVCGTQPPLLERWEVGINYQERLITAACPECYANHLWHKTTG